MPLLRRGQLARQTARDAAGTPPERVEKKYTFRLYQTFPDRDQSEPSSGAWMVRFLMKRPAGREPSGPIWPG